MDLQGQEALLRTPEARFTGNMHRHRGISWSDVLARLQACKVFLYHNGAQSYYAARGFRGALQA